LFLHVWTKNLNAPLLNTKSRHAGESLEAIVNAGFEVAVPIQPLNILNEVTQQPWPVPAVFFLRADGELIDLLEDKTGYT
jgi:hypothetical protein